MHPGEKEAVTATLNFKKSAYLNLHFLIKEGSTHGDILFNVKKNGHEVDRFEVKAGNTAHKLNLYLSPYDNISITADKNGQTSQDWGVVKIKYTDIKAQSVNLLVLFLWLFLFYFLYKKNQSAAAIAFYTLFLLVMIAEKGTFNTIDSKSLLANAATCIAFSIISVALFQEVNNRVVGKALVALISIVIALTLYLIPASFVAYYLSFGIPISQDAINAALQTNTLESVEFIGDFVNFKAFAFFVGLASFVAYAFWWHRRSNIVFIERSMLGVVLILSVSVISLSYYEARLPKYIIENIKAYQAELDEFRAQQARRSVDVNLLSASKEEQDETYIVVIGESHNKKHMQIYGYPRHTTPELAKLKNTEQLLILEQAYSNHTHTMPVLSMALTESAQNNKKNYYESYSIVEILNQAGFESTWLTNQNLLGGWDNLVSIIANQADKVVGINRSIGKTTRAQKYDGDLLPYIQKALNKKSRKNKVIFIHLMGSHGSYCSRFPNEFEIFSESLTIEKFGKNLENSNNSNLINCYDNSVTYNDFILSEIIKMVKQQQGATSLLYFADHAEDVIQGLGHNSGKFTYDMTQIPMLIWLSEGYQKQYPAKTAYIKQQKNTLFSNDQVYDTVIGWTGVKTDYYRPKFDLTSEQYSLLESEATTLHGKKIYTDTDNHFYWQNKNIHFLLQQDLGRRFFPHRVNSFGKLSEIWSKGLRSFEVDILFDYKNDGKFSVGHNNGVMGADFESFVDRVDIKNLQKILLDLKNINTENYEQVLAELNRLDVKYQLKEKSILESGWTNGLLEKFRDAGWQTSYYLPTGKVITALKENQTNVLKEYANEIAEQTQQQNVKSVSFDTQLYPFVKKYLEHLLSEDVSYHVWYGPALADKDFLKKVNHEEIYQDKRIKSFLSSFKSNFNL